MSARVVEEICVVASLKLGQRVESGYGSIGAGMILATNSANPACSRQVLAPSGEIQAQDPDLFCMVHALPSHRSADLNRFSHFQLHAAQSPPKCLLPLH